MKKILGTYAIVLASIFLCASYKPIKKIKIICRSHPKGITLLNQLGEHIRIHDSLKVVFDPTTTFYVQKLITDTVTIETFRQYFKGINTPDSLVSYTQQYESAYVIAKN